jgi:hypothetical protein
VGDRSRGRFATPADFPLQDCSPDRELHARRGRLGFVNRSRASFCFCRAVPKLCVRFATIFDRCTGGVRCVQHGAAHGGRRAAAVAVEGRGWGEGAVEERSGQQNHSTGAAVRRCVFTCGCFRAARLCLKLTVGAAWGGTDANVSPVIRQTLLHWGYELSERDFLSFKKRTKQ